MNREKHVMGSELQVHVQSSFLFFRWLKLRRDAVRQAGRPIRLQRVCRPAMQEKPFGHPTTSRAILTYAPGVHFPERKRKADAANVQTPIIVGEL